MTPQKKTINRPQYNPPSGSLARYTNGKGDKLTVGEYVACRDSFNSQSNMERVCLWHEAKEQGVGEFINAFERRLNHEKLTVWGPTNLSTVTWFEPAAFWFRDMARRSLFTALLRAGQRYDATKDNFQKALYSVGYTQNTKPAIERFLAGYTWAAKSNHANYGWTDQFRNFDKKTIEGALTKRPVTTEDLLQFAMDRLSMSKGCLETEYRKAKHPMRKPNPEGEQASPLVGLPAEQPAKPTSVIETVKKTVKAAGKALAPKSKSTPNSKAKTTPKRAPARRGSR